MDKKLNEVTKVTDMAYVPVIMADGSIGQIAKSDLASVVAGVMNTNKVFPSMMMGDIPNNDCNNAVETGTYFYYIEQGGLDNSPGLSRFVMDVKKNAGGTYQVAYSTGLSDSEQMRQVWYRPCLNNIWLPWQRIDNFGCNSLAELSAGVASEMGVIRKVKNLLPQEEFVVSNSSLGLVVISSNSSGNAGVYIVSVNGVIKITETSNNFSSQIAVSVVDGGGIKVTNIHSASRHVEVVIIANKGT